jgi:hypothetical protein
MDHRRYHIAIAGGNHAVISASAITMHAAGGLQED